MWLWRLKLPHLLIYSQKPPRSWAVPEELSSLRLWTVSFLGRIWKRWSDLTTVKVNAVLSLIRWNSWSAFISFNWFITFLIPCVRKRCTTRSHVVALSVWRWIQNVPMRLRFCASVISLRKTAWTNKSLICSSSSLPTEACSSVRARLLTALLLKRRVRRKKAIIGTSEWRCTLVWIKPPESSTRW